MDIYINSRATMTHIRIVKNMKGLNFILPLLRILSPVSH